MYFTQKAKYMPFLQQKRDPQLRIPFVWLIDGECFVVAPYQYYGFHVAIILSLQLQGDGFAFGKIIPDHHENCGDNLGDFVVNTDQVYKKPHKDLIEK